MSKKLFHHDKMIFDMKKLKKKNEKIPFYGINLQNLSDFKEYLNKYLWKQ